MKSGVFIVLCILLAIAYPVSAVQDLFAIQGKITQKSGGELLDDSNITIEIWDNAIGGNLIFNSTTDFNNSIQDGFYDIVVGSVTELAINFSDVYYIDIAINSEDVDWGNDERRIFQSSTGNETGKSIMIGQDLLVSGNAGIGTLSPQSKLHVVSGDVNFSDGQTDGFFYENATHSVTITGDLIVQGQNTTVPDYVFENNYELMPMDELKSYILKNKQLPGSRYHGKFIIGESNNILEQQYYLLEKIEELTLYMVEMDKRIDEQQILIDEIKSDRQCKS